MHPNRAFLWTDLPAMRAFAAEQAMAQLFAAGSVALAYVPVWVREDGELWLHLSNGNRILKALTDGAEAVAGFAERGHYISANWYADRAGSVPTWNYRSVEVSGRVRRLSHMELVAQLDALSALHEARVCEDWTRAKMDPARFEALLGAITGFALEQAEWRGTWKMSQNKGVGVRNQLEERSGHALPQPA